MKSKIQKIIWDFLYNHPMSILHTDRVLHEVLKRHDYLLFARIPIAELKKAIEEAEKTDQKYFVLADKLKQVYEK